MGYIDLPVSGGGITIYPNLASFPPSAQDGAQGVAADTNSIYIYNASLPGWVAVATPPVGVFISDLTGDVTATGPGSAAATVAFVGGETAADVATSVQDTQAATDAATASTLVKRDSNADSSFNQVNANVFFSTDGVNLSSQMDYTTGVQVTNSGTANSILDSTSLSIIANGGTTAASIDAGSTTINVEDANTGLRSQMIPAQLNLYADKNAPFYLNIDATSTNTVNFRYYEAGGPDVYYNFISNANPNVHVTSGTLKADYGGGDSIEMFPGQIQFQTTTGNVSVSASSAAPYSYSLVLPPAQGGAGEFLQNDGSGNLSWVTISSGANTSLSNLVAPTAVNVALLGTLGSNSAPAYSFSGDTDTGMYSSGANTINLATNGSERLSVDSSGNVKVPNYILSPQLYAGGTKTAAFNIDWSNGPVQEFTLNVSGGTVSLSSSTWSNPVTGGAYMLKLIQGATPTNITAWPASVLWGAAGIPTLSGTTGDIDIINFIYDGTNYYGTYALGF